MNLIDSLIKRVSNQEIPEFVVPVSPSTLRVRVLHNGVNYSWRIPTGTQDGWWVLKSEDAKTVKVIREANAQEKFVYLSGVTKVRMFVLFNTGTSRWVCLPFNISDAISKGMSSYPVEVICFEDNVEPMDIIYSTLDGLEVPGSAERPVEKIATKEYKMARQIIAERAKMEKQKSIDDSIRGELEFLGAKLVDAIRVDGGYKVKWKDGNRSYETIVDRNLRVEETGICLSGLENTFKLAAIVDVIREARKKNRPGSDGV